MVRNLWTVLCVVLVVLCFINFGLCAQDLDTDEINDINKLEDSSEKSSTPSTSPKPKVTQPPKQKLLCPSRQTRIPFFAPTCKTTSDCSFLGPNLMCCYARCIRGLIPPKPEPHHSPLFGMIDRVCPQNPMPEFLPIRECTVDADCGNRICCPERSNGGLSAKNYCRNGAPRFHRMPVVRQMLLPLKSFASYLQCTPPPPPFFDVFPRPCSSILDCFPSLCCQENGKKFCRPPMKSFLALVVSGAQRLGTSSLARNFIQRIS